MLQFQSLFSKFFYPVFFGLIAALLFNLAFPGGPFPLLAWIAVLPIMILLDCEKKVWAVCLGWSVYGIFFWLGAVYWLYSFMRIVLEFSSGMSCLFIFLIVLISAVPYMVVGYVAAKLHLFQGKWGAFKIAALLTMCVAYWPVPFPGDLSMSFYRMPLLIQIADIGGGHFIHFMIIWVNGLIAQGIVIFFKKKTFPRHIWVSLLGIFIFVIGYGYFRLRQYDKLYTQTSLNKFVKIGYVQPNITGSDLSSIFGDYLAFEERQNDFSSAIELTKKLVERSKGLDLIAWPETPEDLPFNHFDWISNSILEVIKKSNGVPFLFESMLPWTGISNKKYTTGKNSIFFIKDGKVSYPYHKVNLIPFSEYLPGEKIFPFLRQLFPYVGDVTPGDKMDYITVNDRLKIIPLICYDGIFPSFVRKFALGGGNVFLSLDNDTNFGPTKASAVHASVMLYRAIENRTPLIRLSNSGPSFTVLSSGEILQGSETKIYEEAYRAVTIFPGGGKTAYQLWGHYFPLIGLIILIIISVLDKRLLWN